MEIRMMTRASMRRRLRWRAMKLRWTRTTVPLTSTRSSRRSSRVRRTWSSSSSSSFYLPNNATVCTFARRRAGQQGPIRTLTAALKRLLKTVTGCVFYHMRSHHTGVSPSSLAPCYCPHSFQNRTADFQNTYYPSAELHSRPSPSSLLITTTPVL